MIDGFEMRFSTIKRDSALLNGYGRVRDAVAALDEAWDELKSLGALHSIDKKEHRGGRNKIEDVTYTIKAARDFSAEQKAANRRRSDAQRDATQPSSTGGSGAGWLRAGNVVASTLHLPRPRVE